MVTNPRLLLLDEPMEGLAPIIVEELAGVLRELTRAGSMAIILVEQRAELALSLAPRGVAYVSYNTNPGWRLRGITRDLLLYGAPPDDGLDPRPRLPGSGGFPGGLEAVAHLVHLEGQRRRPRRDGPRRLPGPSRRGLSGSVFGKGREPLLSLPGDSSPGRTRWHIKS